MVDMVRSASPHREATYLGHTFHFRTTTGTLVERFVVSPAVVPSCLTAARLPGAAAAASALAAASAETLQVNGTEANSTALASSVSPRSRTGVAKSRLLSRGDCLVNGESECGTVCVGSGSPAAAERAGALRSLRLLAPRLD